MSAHSNDERELIERFITAYNAIDHELRHRVGSDTYDTFSQVVDKYAARNPAWSYGRILKRYGDLRNVLSHGPTRPDERLAIPTLQVVEAIQKIRDSFSLRVIPEFKREVTVVHPDTSLANVFGLVKQHQYSQFPVQHADGQIQGLLTANGITRWLARHTVAEMSLVEFADVTVAAVLDEEETSHNYRLVSRTMLVDEVFSLFARESLLEAVLITHSGKANETPLGIVTRWDLPWRNPA
jgi:predicted transcriptional regulator